MSNTVIKVENLGKLYRLGEIGTGTLSHDLNRWWSRVRGKEDPFAKIGETNDRTTKGDSDYVWALKEVNFEVKQGEVLGIIGRNGAGKSTLLKILSKVTSPGAGSLKIKGRIASLLEVGTGFHPELTGRENIFLNGAILGMTKREIQNKFDEIVDFSGVERYIDTPVKRYSSGMYVRLAFAVAAFLEPEILIVDEVLAVGDAEFQKKCIGRMKDVSANDGRTVLFVSHNMAAVRTLCNKGLVLKNGTDVFYGSQSEAVDFYQNLSGGTNSSIIAADFEGALGNDNLKILRFEVLPRMGDVLTIFSGIVFQLEFFNHLTAKNIDVTLEVKNQDDILVFHNGGFVTTNSDSKPGVYQMNFQMPMQFLNAGIYTVSLLFGENQRYVLFKGEDLLSFEILHETTGSNSSKLPGLTLPELTVETFFKSSSYEFRS